MQVSPHEGVLVLGLLQALNNQLLLLLVLRDSQDNIVVGGHGLVTII
jgi:hypothetical protein